MITKLSELYKALEIGAPTQELLTKRTNAIKAIVKKKDRTWMFDCIRIYLGKLPKNAGFSSEMTKAFTESDPVFDQKNNELELQVLAGAIIGEAIQGEDGLAVALALETARFQTDEKDVLNKEIILDSQRRLHGLAISERQFEETDDDKLELEIDAAVTEVNNDHLTAKFKAVNDELQTINAHVNEKVNYLVNRISVLEEESNIHWWVFRGYSKGLGKLFSHVAPGVAPFFVGRELAELTTTLPFSPAYEGFIAKVLKDGFAGGLPDVSLSDAINENLQFFNSTDSLESAKEFGNICPLMNAFNYAAQSNDKSGWISFFEKSSRVNATNKVGAMELARQIYLETMLMDVE